LNNIVNIQQKNTQVGTLTSRFIFMNILLELSDIK
jgi:hypothetical protein